MKTSSERAPDGGVVLLELLSALSILAIMSALAAGMLGQMRSVSRLAAETTARAEIIAAADHLARTIAAARPVPLPGSDGAAAPVLVGTAEGLRFVAITRRGFETLGLSEVSIAPRGAPGDLALVETLRAAHQPSAPMAATVIVADGLAAAEFTYIDAKGVARSSWASDALPAGVRITLARVHAGRPIRAEAFAPTR